MSVDSPLSEADIVADKGSVVHFGLVCGHSSSPPIMLTYTRSATSPPQNFTSLPFSSHHHQTSSLTSATMYSENMKPFIQPPATGHQPLATNAS